MRSSQLNIPTGKNKRLKWKNSWMDFSLFIIHWTKKGPRKKGKPSQTNHGQPFVVRLSAYVKMRMKSNQWTSFFSGIQAEQSGFHFLLFFNEEEEFLFTIMPSASTSSSIRIRLWTQLSRRRMREAEHDTKDERRDSAAPPASVGAACLHTTMTVRDSWEIDGHSTLWTAQISSKLHSTNRSFHSTLDRSGRSVPHYCCIILIIAPVMFLLTLIHP